MKQSKQRDMKKIYILLLAVLWGAAVSAQLYNNEWIDPNKTYYKFKSARTGIFRIEQSTLAALGFGATPVQQFKLWRNGVEVPLYTTSLSGPLPANGYIQFWGWANDGKADKALYRDPNFQHTDKISLQTDTAVYFLTTNTTSANKRFYDVPNDVASNVLPAEPYFIHKASKYFRERINPGFAAVVGEYVYSSSYDKGEFFSTFEINPATPRTDAQTNLYPYLAGPAASIRFGAVGNALNTRTVKVRVNNTDVKDTLCDYFNDVVANATVPIALLSSGNADVQFVNTSPTSTDRMVVSHYELSYPRIFNFGGANTFQFELAAKNDGYYLEISNFDGGATPVLYDLTYQERIPGDLSTPGMIKFAISGGTSDRQMLLVNENIGNIQAISQTELKVKNFTNFNLPANQGDYLIISNPILYNGANGVNPVEEYRLYRSSVNGGGYTAKTIEIDELVDQFGFGIKKHPLAVKNFIRYARTKFAAAPKFVLIIGRGIAYNEYRNNQNSPLADQLNLVPTYGWPASDNFLASPDVLNPVPATPLGRISAINAKEVEDYLEKLKEYESAQKNNPNTIAARGWMKNVLQVTGASDSYLGTVLCNYMATYSQIAEDTLLGASVSTFCKTSTNPVEQLSNEKIAQLFEEGLSLVTYFGHSSATTLEFNLDNPQNYNNLGKYPVFSVNGCNAGNFFTFDPQRFTYNETLSEKFTLAKQRGGVAFIASTHFGIVNYLNIYINSLYDYMARSDYGASLGKLSRDATQKLVQIAGTGDYYARLHAEEITLHGDPALKLNFQALPDYVIEEPQVKVNPQFISIAEDKFHVDIKVYNLGKALRDSITVEVKQRYPDNSEATLIRKRIKGIRFKDSLSFDVPIVATRDKGLNKLIITVDADNQVTEMTELNNTISKDIFIYEDEARPASPYNYSIITQQGIKLYASTANPFSNLKQYVMEIDTTENFNSPLKVVKTLNSVGGLLEFDPGISFRDSTVYYWRTSYVPSGGGDYRWNMASFIYLPASTGGFNQSHYYQHQKSQLERIKLNTDRTWKYENRNNSLFVRNAVYPTAATQDNEFSVSVNGDTYMFSACVGRSIIFHVFDPITFKPWKNTDANGNNLNIGGSGNANCAFGRDYNFEFSCQNAADRKKAMDFMQTIIPNGYYVAIRNIPLADSAFNKYVSDWKADTTLYGSGQSLYHSLFNAGLTQIDSFYRPRVYAFVYKKGDATFTPKQKVSDGIYDRILLLADCPTPDTLGYITSPNFGPAKNWKNVHWRGSSEEVNSQDNPTIDIIGVTPTNVETTLFTINKNQQDFDISSINAAQYPYVKLKMRNIDSVTLTPYQLRYWRIEYDALPEGALVPNLFFRTKDTLDIGEKLNFGIAFKNISLAAFDSVKMKMYILDRNNSPVYINLPKRKPLVSGDSIRFEYEIDTKDLPGLNTLYVEFNPDNDQPEQFKFNNFMFRNFYVKPDNINPLLDVTFDGVHILNRDIVSARPHIQIKLKDEAKYMLLNDTAGATVQIRFPDNNNTVRTYRFDGDTLRFNPSTNGNDNTASIDFYPNFPVTAGQEDEEREYELIVKGKDRSGNKAGTTEYKVTFRIIDKPMISNLLNYPNPFTTSTAFVFTITGSQVPDNMKIQILTVTGKVVREITKEELGLLHIGRNITEFKWDGTDQFGQRLANGVYLYRFVTTLNGKKMDKYKSDGESTDKFFKSGYGKMYLMR